MKLHGYFRNNIVLMLSGPDCRAGKINTYSYFLFSVVTIASLTGVAILAIIGNQFGRVSRLPNPLASASDRCLPQGNQWLILD